MDSGLENIVAAETSLSDVKGDIGELIINGWYIEKLASSMAYEDVAHLLWQSGFDEVPGAHELGRALGDARVEAFQNLPEANETADIIQYLRMGWAKQRDDETLGTAIRLAAGGLVFTAAAIRLAAAQSPIAPNPNLSSSADFLQMITGDTPDANTSRALDSYLVTVSDHGLNASTFAARVVSSTRAGLTSAVLGGLSALKGPLHGGAPGPVLDMFDEIGEASKAEAWIDNALANGARLMGFGHRVYRARDPRADALKTAASRLAGTAGRIAFAEHIEREVLGKLRVKYPDRALETNVEFYTAILLEALEIPREAFTAVFACGRVLGWVAHAREQISEGRIVRPKSVYRGPLPASV